MSNGNQRKTYFPFNPKDGYPAGKYIYYECLECGEVLQSLPNDSTICSCKNIAIDVDYGRISIKNHRLIKIFSSEHDL